MNIAIRKINTTLFSPKAFWFMIVGIILLVLTYIYLVNSIVWNVSLRQQTEKRLADLTAQLSTMESTYVSLTSKINIENAYNLGFKDISSDQTEFVKRSATLGTLGERHVQ